MIGRWMLAAACCLLVAGQAQAARRYTVDDLLRLEDFGKVRFDPTGHRLVFERYGRFDRQSDYSRSFVIGELRSKILTVDLDSSAPPKAAFEQAESDGYALYGLSPDGSRIAYGRLSAGGLRPGLAGPAGQTGREASVTPRMTSGRDATWVGGGVLFTALSDGHLEDSVSFRAELIDELERRWSTMRKGQEATASELGSGRFANYAGAGDRLVLAEGDAAPRSLAPGSYRYWFASPDGRHVAALREDRLILDPKHPMEHGANIGAIQRTLLVIPAKSGAAIEPCAHCDVLDSSVNWSPSGRQVAFFARRPETVWSQAQFYVFDVASGRASVVAAPGYSPHFGRAGSVMMDVRSAWLGERLALLVDPVKAGVAAPDRDARADWVLLGARGAINLTGAMAGKTPNLVATNRDGLALIQDGKLWFVDAAGRSRRLAAEVSAPLAEWREPTPFGELPHWDMQPAAVGQFIAQGKDGAPSGFVFVDLATGKADVVAVPEGTKTIAAASPAARSIAVLVNKRNATELAIIDRSGARRDIMEINTHLKDVAGATPVRIDHKGPKGDLRHSWLLLPPGYRQGDRLPTIVNVYPGSTLREVYTRWKPDSLNALNDEVLVGQGYAVLYPSIPVEYEKTPRDPLTGLVDEVFAAVDAAASAGYVDEDRLGVQGQSYGGYTTGALIGLTDRFKSAVAQAGLYDLISSYGEFDARRRLQLPYSGLDLFAVSLMETSQGGMGAPPWKDPQRYLRNSPLMYVDAVRTPVMLMNGDLDYVSTTQSEEYFTALTRLGKDAVYVRYYGEDHVFSSPANIRDMWARIIAWYGRTLGPPTPAAPKSAGAAAGA